MKKIAALFLTLLFPIFVFAGNLKSGDELIAAMHKKYKNQWYKTLTFTQKTVFYKPDGTSEVQTWYEAMSIPSKLRIDIAPLEKNNGLLFVDGMLHQFRNGKLIRSQAFIHSLLVLGFDVYLQPVEKTVRELKDLKMNLSIIREDKWQGRRVYVVGAKAGDLKSPQFWIDKKNLYFVRLIEPIGKDNANTQEVQFNKYVKVRGGGWISPEVLVFVDGKTTQTEEYTNIQTGISLDKNLFETEKWLTVDRKYFEKED